jgi:hypothetical protein
MKILIALSFLLSLLFASMIAWDIFTTSDTTLESEVTVQVPVPVVFKLLSNPDAFCQPSSMIQSIRQGTAPDLRITTYRFADKTRSIEEKVLLNPSQNRIQFKQNSAQPEALIGNLSNTITIKTLPDGAVSVTWQLQYKALSLGTRLLNSIFIRSQMQQALDRSVSALGTYIER